MPKPLAGGNGGGAPLALPAAGQAGAPLPKTGPPCSLRLLRLGGSMLIVLRTTHFFSVERDSEFQTSFKKIQHNFEKVPSQITHHPFGG